MEANRNHASILISHCDPSEAFGLITDLRALPSWNQLVETVITRTDALGVGAVWKVGLRDGALRWTSESVVTDYDPDTCTFACRSATDDGDPSHVEWRWSVRRVGADALVTVRWRLDPRMRARKLFFAPYRARRLRAEVPRSLQRLAEMLRSPVEPAAPLTMVGIWAHPDDETYLSATLMQRVVEAGGRVVVVTATWGEAGVNLPRDLAVRTRRAELRGALAELGVSALHCLELPDGGLDSVDGDAVTDRLAALLEQIDPDLVVTFPPDGITGHPDHRAVSRWALSVGQRRRRGTLLLATLTDEFVARNDQLHERIGMAMDGPLVSVPDHAVVRRIVPSPSERSSKCRALDAHRSQTEPLRALLGDEVFYDWCVDETFREPNSDDFAWASSSRMRELVR